MRVLDLAKELGVTSDEVLSVLKSLKLKAKGDKQELNAAVIAVLRRQLGKKASVPKTEEIKTEAKTKKITVKAQEKIKPAAKEKKTVKKEKVRPVQKKTTAAKKPAVKKIKTTVKKAVKKIVKKKRVAAKKAGALIEAEPMQKKLPEKQKLRQPVSAATLIEEPKKKEVPRRPPKEPVPAVEEKIAEKKPLEDIEIQLPITVKDLAVRIQQKPSILLKKLVEDGIFANINQNLGEDIVKKLAADFGFSIKKIKTQEEQLIDAHVLRKKDAHLLKPRAPVVTLMGHVDHGKTSLLDRIRKSNIIDKEHGGITQHIGAYSVNLPRGKITFLDTPGHEAFTSMRARGAHITDLVVVVIAADEGIMPQTEEAIDHAQAAGVPIVIALNKIDKRNADIDRVKKQLSDRELMPEDWGGKTIVVGVSATTGEGINTLLEMILLEAEMLELKSHYEEDASGIVVEAHLSKGKGSVSTVIVQNGILKEGDIVVIGPHYGKIKAMFDDHQRPIKEAGPVTPIEILGLSGVPEAGEMFYAIKDERRARDIVAKRQEYFKSQKIQATQKITLEDLYSQIQEGKIKELGLILKADVRGSLEAIKDSLEKLSTKEVKLKFIHIGVGDVNASDVILAGASNAIIIAFNVGLGTRAYAELEKNPVDIRTYRIIYDVINDIKNALVGMLEPRTRKNFLGRVEIRQVFKLSRAGIVAGCYVTKGKIHRKASVDIVRNGQSVFSGAISSLKRFKDDVREVGEGYECGITIHGYSEIEVGDIIEAYELEKIARTL